MAAQPRTWRAIFQARGVISQASIVRIGDPNRTRWVCGGSPCSGSGRRRCAQMAIPMARLAPTRRSWDRVSVPS